MDSKEIRGTVSLRSCPNMLAFCKVLYIWFCHYLEDADGWPSAGSINLMVSLCFCFFTLAVDGSSAGFYIVLYFYTVFNCC